MVHQYLLVRRYAGWLTIAMVQWFAEVRRYRLASINKTVLNSRDCFKLMAFKVDIIQIYTLTTGLPRIYYLITFLLLATANIN